MAEFPALPLYTDAYLADTRHLTTEEHGAYLLLLMCMWRTRGCALRDDDKLLARIVGVSSRRWMKLRLVLEDFFLVADGQWQQKKLNLVYEAVAAKVEKNRSNGAKGGKVRAARAKALKNKESLQAPAPSLVEAKASQTGSKKQATKAKTESKESSGSREMEALYSEVTAASGLLIGRLEKALIKAWLDGGCDPQQDILATITRLKEREEIRQGKAPLHLAYYNAAVEEAKGSKKPVHRISDAEARLKNQRLFDRKNPEHWRTFLGNASSRYRGDYMSQNWIIPSGHPVFIPADIGPDPRVRFNRSIPSEVYSEYAAFWGWQQPRKR
ncbi:DUF1376 domain-containing protein [Kordiimonas laminariae]|uniref:DUF1376 domain-containing protein n=1 Tax=Kordiimonas laminariae TaxID=2917717 RepID=UPI001FF271BB|nr:DUF1376 domain-containing protein [Kordiimonas laminariae]